MSPSISIVTACYNSVAFLDRIHGSLLKQTCRDFEWVCVDDLSTDETLAQLLQLKAPGKLGMQVYALPQNSGGSVAVALAMQRAKGEVVVLLDHDDELFPEALEQVAANWHRVGPTESGLFLRAVDPSSSEMIGRKLTTGRRLTWNEMSNRYPDVCDGTFAFRADLLREFASIERMEPIMLLGAMLVEITAGRPLVNVDVPVRYYHRDNVDSQTRWQRVSRKNVATYARVLDGADRYYLLAPVRWVRHVVTLFRYARLVHGRASAAIGHIERPSMRWFARAIWPVGRLARYLNDNEVLVDSPYFEPALAESLPDPRKSKKRKK